MLMAEEDATTSFSNLPSPHHTVIGGVPCTFTVTSLTMAELSVRP